MTIQGKEGAKQTPYIYFDRPAWARLRASTALPLTEQELEQLRGIHEQVSLDEVSDVYLPLSRLLDLYVDATRNLYRATHTFLGGPAPKVPYIIGIAGSVAVGKSTTARIIQALLSRWPSHPKVDLVTTDGFLYPNRILEERGLMNRKGFPESYDVRKLLDFVSAVKSGVSEVIAPVYSHLSYDVLPEESIVIQQPDIMILEGLNVLQAQQGSGSHRPGHGAYSTAKFVSDFFDFTVYVDADERDIERWYLERFHTLRQTAFQNPASYFHRYAEMSPEDAGAFARRVWKEINAVNLRENIAPTKARAQLILQKDPTHAVSGIYLRKL